MKRMSLIAALLLAATPGSGALAQDPGAVFEEMPPAYVGPLPPNPPPSWLAEGRSVAEWDRLRYDYSGTRGRMGLGASPFRPEGPGNFSSAW